MFPEEFDLSKVWNIISDNEDYQTIKSFSQNPEFSERIKNFINALISSKGDISLTINNCNQNELGILRNVIIDNFKPDIDIEHLKIIKLLLDLIEANHFVRFVRE